MSRKTSILGFSVPPELAREYEKMAKQERKTKSELFRDMIKLYKQYREEKEFYRLQTRMTEHTQKLGIRTEEDVKRLIQEVRGA